MAQLSERHAVRHSFSPAVLSASVLKMSQLGNNIRLLYGLLLPHIGIRHAKMSRPEDLIVSLGKLRLRKICITTGENLVGE